ncbi:MAG: hypothetical protein AAB544_05470, partial [Patescibacteria group bacterium]
MKKIIPFSAMTSVLLLVAAAVSLQGGGAAVTEQSLADCIGKPYGYPGCPVKKEATSFSSSSAAPLNCGDGVLDDDEECDLGRHNGITNCTEECQILFCGDGKVNAHIGEQCEPEVEEVYVLDDVSGVLTTQIRFIQKSCGTFCSPPVCDEKGFCKDGCKLIFLAACAASSSSASATPLAL